MLVTEDPITGAKNFHKDSRSKSGYQSYCKRCRQIERMPDYVLFNVTSETPVREDFPLRLQQAWDMAISANKRVVLQTPAGSNISWKDIELGAEIKDREMELREVRDALDLIKFRKGVLKTQYIYATTRIKELLKNE